MQLNQELQRELIDFNQRRLTEAEEALLARAIADCIPKREFFHHAIKSRVTKRVN